MPKGQDLRSEIIRVWCHSGGSVAMWQCRLMLSYEYDKAERLNLGLLIIAHRLLAKIAYEILQVTIASYLLYRLLYIFHHFAAP